MKSFIPALRYHALTSAYDLLVRLTMPETAFKHRLIDRLNCLIGTMCSISVVVPGRS